MVLKPSGTSSTAQGASGRPLAVRARRPAGRISPDPFGMGVHPDAFGAGADGESFGDPELADDDESGGAVRVDGWASPLQAASSTAVVATAATRQGGGSCRVMVCSS